MELMTKELEEKFEKYPIGSQDGLWLNAKVVVKYFNPCGAGTWLITEGNKLDDGDYELYGYCNLGDSEMAEYGYVSLNELKSIKLPFGLTIERDLYMEEDCTMEQAMLSSGIDIPEWLKDKKDIEL